MMKILIKQPQILFIECLSDSNLLNPDIWSFAETFSINFRIACMTINQLIKQQMANIKLFIWTALFHFFMLGFVILFSD